MLSGVCLLGVALGPPVCNFLFSRTSIHYHVDPGFYIVGSVITTVGFLFVRLSRVNGGGLALVALIGFFSFLGVFPLGIILGLLARIFQAMGG